MKKYDLEKFNLRLAKQYVREIKPTEVTEIINDDHIDWTCDVNLESVIDDYLNIVDTPRELINLYQIDFDYYGLNALYYDGDMYYRITQI